MSCHAYRAGIIKGFTGIDQAYEEPLKPDLSLDTVNRTVQDTMMDVITLLEENVSLVMGVMPMELKLLIGCVTVSGNHSEGR